MWRQECPGNSGARWVWKINCEHNQIDIAVVIRQGCRMENPVPRCEVWRAFLEKMRTLAKQAEIRKRLPRDEDKSFSSTQTKQRQQ